MGKEFDAIAIFDELYEHMDFNGCGHILLMRSVFKAHQFLLFTAAPNPQRAVVRG